MTVAAGWENFYTIVGSSAGAPIGLQFAVASLVAARPAQDGLAETRGSTSCKYCWETVVQAGNRPLGVGVGRS